VGAPTEVALIVPMREHVIKKELERNPGSPGRYYPVNDATWQLYEEYRRRGEA